VKTMGISSEEIKKLRELTSCGVIDCKKALEEAGGDMKKAQEILLRRGLEIAAKKSGREAKEGRIESYVHMGNKIAVIVEVNCETDFVARNEDFIRFTKDLAMHIAAAAPKYLTKEEVPADVLAGQPNQEEFIKSACLMEQGFIKDPGLSIANYLSSLVAKIGENIRIGRFTRYKVGDVE
jgi:elongation factor Ts